MTAPVRIGEPIVVDVALAARGYSIVIGRGQLITLGQRIAALRPRAKAAIVSDETVVRYHLAATEAALASAGIVSTCITVPSGENSKSFPMLQQVCEALVAARMERGDLVVALGGGVIGDLAGFAAAIVRRGLDYVQVPTTLLAQVDSSVGGKTAIDSRHGKNLIGAFYQPVLVLSDAALLDTLSDREFRAGYAEVAKYGLIGDAAFFEWLEANWREVFAGGPARERELGERALLNLGHTFGHALEAATGFSGALLHGEAVSLGITLAFAFSVKRGLLPAAEAERVERHLARVGLPTDVSSITGGAPDVDRLMDLMAQDKKIKQGKLTLILVRGIGKSFIAANMEAAEVRAFLVEKLSQR